MKFVKKNVLGYTFQADLVACLEEKLGKEAKVYYSMQFAFQSSALTNYNSILLNICFLTGC